MIVGLVLGFCLSEVALLSHKYSVPLVDVVIVEGVIRRTKQVAFYNVDMKTIVVDDIFLRFWGIDRVKTEKNLKWLMAHEFYHHLVEYRRPINILKELKGLEERRASLFAYRETGIKWSEVKEYFRELERAGEWT